MLQRRVGRGEGAPMGTTATRPRFPGSGSPSPRSRKPLDDTPVLPFGMLHSLGSLLRPIVSCVAIFQVAVGALTLEHSARSGAEPGPAIRIEHQHQHEGLPLHDPELCPVCQFHSTPLLRPEATRVLPVAEQSVRPSSAAVRLPAARGPPSAHQTRAPPRLA